MDLQTTTETIIQLEERHGSGALKPAPLVLVKGSGVRLLDGEGKAYLDCGSGIGVAALGHSHPALVRAITDQAGTLVTTSDHTCCRSSQRSLLGISIVSS